MVACFGLVKENGDTVPLKSVNVSIKLSGYMIEVSSSLCYFNDDTDAVEATYVFPVDDRSAVYKFEADIHNRHIVAEIQEKEQALLTYQDAIDHGQTALLLKEDETSRDVFKCMLGNLPAGAPALVTISYVMELPQDPDGRLRFTLPTILNPRYSPDAGSTIAAEGASYLPACNIPYTFNMVAVVQGYHKITSIESEKLQLNVQYENDNRTAMVTLKEKFEFDHDLSLLVQYEKPYEPQVILERGNPDAAGLLKADMLMLSFYPKLEEVTMATNGEYIFVVDRSGSMSGSCIDNAKEALLLFLKSLPANCYFNIVSFGSSFSSLFSQGSKLYSKSTLKEAIKLQESIKSNMGGTEILKPLENILKKKSIDNHPRQIFVLTDGEVSNQNEVINLVRKHNKVARVFALGIGDGVSTHLVNGIARAGLGKAEFVSGSQRIQPKVISLLRCAMQPCVNQIEIDWELPPGITHIPIPTEPPVLLLPGERIALYTIMQNADPHAIYAASTVTLKGIHDNKPVSYTMTFTLSDDTDNIISAPAHRLATKTQIKLLEDEENQLRDLDKLLYDSDNSSEAKLSYLRQKIVNLSRHGNVISKHTAFVGIDTEGAKVEGSMIKKPCPVPTLAPGFVNSYRESNMRSCCLMDCGFDDAGMDEIDGPTGRSSLAESGLVERADMCLQSASPMKRKMRKKGGGFGCGFSYMTKKLSFRKNSKKSASYDTAPGPAPARSAQVHSTERNDMEQVCPESLQLGDDTMLRVISLQELEGNWRLTSDIVSDLRVTMETIQTVIEIKDKSVVCTLAVIYWLRSHFSHRSEEWQIIEAKALAWCAQQNLTTKPVDELITEIGKTVWPQDANKLSNQNTDNLNESDTKPEPNVTVTSEVHTDATVEKGVADSEQVVVAEANNTDISLDKSGDQSQLMGNTDEGLNSPETETKVSENVEEEVKEDTTVKEAVPNDVDVSSTNGPVEDVMVRGEAEGES